MAGHERRERQKEREMSPNPPPTRAGDIKSVVLVTVDSLRADYVFGSKTPGSLETLPWLVDDRLAFSNAFSNAVYTKGSFRSILSGTYMWTFDSASDGYGPDRPHVTELLSGAGYATAGFQTNAFLGPTYNYGRGSTTIWVVTPPKTTALRRAPGRSTAGSSARGDDPRNGGHGRLTVRFGRPPPRRLARQRPLQTRRRA